MSNEDLFEDNRSIRIIGIVFSVVALMLCAVPFGVGEFHYTATEVDQSIVVFFTQGVLLVALSAVAVMLSRSVIEDSLSSAYIKIAVSYLGVFLLQSTIQFFVFFYGFKEYAQVVNGFTLFLHVVVATVAIKNIMQITKH